MSNLLVEDVIRIKSLMGIINESKISLPIVVSGSYTAPKGDADALHSFERRKSDGFGGRMTSKVDEKLKEVYKAMAENIEKHFITYQAHPIEKLKDLVELLEKMKEVKDQVNEKHADHYEELKPLLDFTQIYTKISEKVILDNLREIREKKIPVEFFQIDDGYQKEIGEWLTPNAKFPAGMQFLAEEIKKVNG